MDDLILTPTEEESGPETTFYIGTVTAWNIETGAEIKLDGQDSAMTKRFKVLQCGRPLYTNRRYLIIKQSGTYIVGPEIGMPTRWAIIEDLASGASTSDIVTTVNNILKCMRNQGILYT